MAVAPLKPSAFIQAAGYTKGRAKKVIYLGVHTAEGSTNVKALGNYFHGTKAGSSNAGIGQAGEYAEYVTYNNTPWTNPPINSQADTVEICGFARWTRLEWLAHPKLLETVAHWIAWRCAVRGIPIVHRHDGQTGSGVFGHRDVNAAWHKSTHTDPGPNFPWDVVMARAATIAGTAPKPAPQPAHKVVPTPTRKDPIIKLGSRGQAVKNVQHALHLHEDGIFGKQTQAAVKTFQAKHKLTADGVVGPATWAALRK